MVTEPVMRLVSGCTDLVRGDSNAPLSQRGSGNDLEVRQPHHLIVERGERMSSQGEDKTMIMTWGIEWCEVESPIGIPPRGLRQVHDISRVNARITRLVFTGSGLVPQAPFCTTSQHRVISCSAGPPFSLPQSSTCLDIRDTQCLPLPSPTTLLSALGSSGP